MFLLIFTLLLIGTPINILLIAYVPQYRAWIINLFTKAKRIVIQHEDGSVLQTVMENSPFEEKIAYNNPFTKEKTYRLKEDGTGTFGDRYYGMKNIKWKFFKDKGAE